MSFTTTAYYRNFSVIPEVMRTPVPLEGLTQVALQSELSNDDQTLTAAQLMGGSLYIASSTSARTYTLPSGEDMMKTFGKNLDKYINNGSIVRLEVVNSGSATATFAAGVGGSQAKVVEAIASGTGACTCVNIKFTTSTGTYIVF
jgi:hypothetical protein